MCSGVGSLPNNSIIPIVDNGIAATNFNNAESSGENPPTADALAFNREGIRPLLVLPDGSTRSAEETTTELANAGGQQGKANPLTSAVETAVSSAAGAASITSSDLQDLEASASSVASGQRTPPLATILAIQELDASSSSSSPKEASTASSRDDVLFTIPLILQEVDAGKSLNTTVQSTEVSDAGANFIAVKVAGEDIGKVGEGATLSVEDALEDTFEGSGLGDASSANTIPSSNKTETTTVRLVSSVDRKGGHLRKYFFVGC